MTLALIVTVTMTMAVTVTLAVAVTVTQTDMNNTNCTQRLPTHTVDLLYPQSTGLHGVPGTPTPNATKDSNPLNVVMLSFF